MSRDVRGASGAPLALLAYVLWGLLTFYWKAVGNLGPVDLIGWRIVTSAAVLAAVCAARGALPAVASTLRTPRSLGDVTATSLLLTVNWSTYVWAVVEGHVVETALGYFISPILTTIIGVVVLREPLSRVRRAALTLAGTGLVVLTLAYGRAPWIALAIASSWSAYGYLKKRTPLAPLEGLTAEVAVLSLPAVALVVVRWGATDGVPATASTAEWILVLLAGLVTAGPLLLFSVAAQRTPLTVLGPMQYVVPTIHFLIGWLGFGEEVTRTKFVGFGLIWACLALVLSEFLRDQRAATAIRAAGSSPRPPA
jgi:chloramphenicol-sensitive protein RarD